MPFTASRNGAAGHASASLAEHSDPTYRTLLIEAGDVATTVTVNRPQSLNALSELVLTELATYLRSMLDPQKIATRGLILTGAGDRAFIAGADIREMSAMTPGQGEAFGRLGQQVTELLETVPIPVIACVNGYALGGGCEIAMGCDYVYCTDNAVFGQPEVSLGLIPGFGGCVRLQRLIGPGHAREMIYTGGRITAEEASGIGLVNRVFTSRQEMLAAAHRSLAEVATRSPVAVALCKASINTSAGRPTSEGLDIERDAFRRSFTSEDMREGTQAFLAKREPHFPGFSPAE